MIPGAGARRERTRNRSSTKVYDAQARVNDSTVARIARSASGHDVVSRVTSLTEKTLHR
jgi:hypothetical protein